MAGIGIVVIVIATKGVVLLYKLKANASAFNRDHLNVVEIDCNRDGETTMGGRLGSVGN